MSRKKKKTADVASSCERILALLKASQRQLEYLAHEHLSFEQVLRVEQELRVGSSPERAEIQRMRLLLDARLDHVRQMRAITSLAPLTFMPSEKERIQELQSLQSFVQPYSKDDSSKGEQSKENGPSPIKTEAKLHQSDADSAMDPAFQARDLGSLEEGSKPVVSPSDNSPPETVPQAQAEAEAEAQAAAEAKAVAEAKAEAEAQAEAEAKAAAEAKAEAEAQAEAEVEAKSIPKSATEHIPKPAIDSAKSPEAPETPSTPIPLAAAPIALGGSPVQSSETGLSIQVLQSSPETSIDKSPSTLLDGKLKELMRRATTAHSDGEIERAIEAYSDLLDQADDHVPTLLARGRCHLEKKDFSAAISDFRRAQKLLPNDPSPLVALGDLFLSRKDHDTAIGHFDSAIALQKDHPQARCRRGLAHYHCGRYRQAFLDLQRAYKLDPEIPNIRRLVQMAIRKLEENP